MGATVGVDAGEDIDVGVVASVWTTPRFVERSLGRIDQKWLTAGIAIVAACLAFLIRWTQDDSYITLRYARNLVEGRGLVYNPGEQVEGYTNFLWTVLMAVPLRLGRDPVLFGHVVGIACMVVSILATVAIGTRVFGSRVMGNFAALVLLTNSTFIAYGTGGLETQLQTALVLLVWLVLLPALLSDAAALRHRDLALASFLAGLALLTRLDSAVLLAVPLLVVCWAVFRSPVARASRSFALVTPAAVLVVPWTMWRYSTYGSLLPNTAVAKENPLRITLLQGGSYLFLFLVLNLLVVFGPTALVHGRALLARRPFVPLVITLGLWVLYLLKVGADFMEFRFMVASLPLLSIVLVGLIAVTVSSFWQKALVAALVLGLFVHLAVMGSTGGMVNLDSTGNLDDYVTNPDSGLAALGVELHEVLHGSEAAEELDSGATVISTGGAGAIPYFARLRNVDPLGLTDAWTAEHGLRLETATIPKQGHSRMATFEHLNGEGVNLLISTRRAPQPEGYDADDLDILFRGATPDVEHLRDGASVVEIPMADGTVYWAVYLNPHPDIDAAIASGRWNEVALRP